MTMTAKFKISETLKSLTMVSIAGTFIAAMSVSFTTHAHNAEDQPDPIVYCGAPAAPVLVFCHHKNGSPICTEYGGGGKSFTEEQVAELLQILDI